MVYDLWSMVYGFGLFSFTRHDDGRGENGMRGSTPNLLIRNEWYQSINQSINRMNPFWFWGFIHDTDKEYKSEEDDVAYMKSNESIRRSDFNVERFDDSLSTNALIAENPWEEGDCIKRITITTWMRSNSLIYWIAGIKCNKRMLLQIVAAIGYPHSIKNRETFDTWKGISLGLALLLSWSHVYFFWLGSF